MSLAMRWAICFPVLNFALRGDLSNVSVAVADDESLIIFIDDDEFGFGFGEGLPGESAVEAAERLLDDLDSELPSTGRGWAQPLLRCPVEGHQHMLTTTPNEADYAIDLWCPQVPGSPQGRIDLGVPGRQIGATDRV